MRLTMRWMCGFGERRRRTRRQSQRRVWRSGGSWMCRLPSSLGRVGTHWTVRVAASGDSVVRPPSSLPSPPPPTVQSPSPCPLLCVPSHSSTEIESCHLEVHVSLVAPQVHHGTHHSPRYRCPSLTHCHPHYSPFLPPHPHFVSPVHFVHQTPRQSHRDARKWSHGDSTFAENRRECPPAACHGE